MPHIIIFIIVVLVLGVCLDISFAEKDDDLSERDVSVLCGASEDYEENKEQCDKLYDMLEEGEIEDDPDFEYN